MSGKIGKVEAIQWFFLRALHAYVRFEQERANIRRDAQSAVRRAADRMSRDVLDELAAYYSLTIADTEPPPPSGASVN